jgi:hypothetical protein
MVGKVTIRVDGAKQLEAALRLFRLAESARG